VLAQLLQRVNTCKRDAEAAAAEAADSRGAAEACALARLQTQEMQATFRRFDKDSDGLLSRKELLAYSEAACRFPIAESALDRIWESRAEYSAKHGIKGIMLRSLPLVKIAIGIEREMQRDRQRREERETREKRLEEMRAEMQEHIKRATETVTEADQAITKVEDTVKQCATKGRLLPVPEMLSLAEQIDELIVTATDAVKTAQESMAGLKEGIDDGFKDTIMAFVTGETKAHVSRLGRMEGRIKRATNLLAQFREEARRKRVEDIIKVRSASLRLARYQQQINDLSAEELFSKIDVGGDGTIDKDDYVTFFESADKVIRSVSPEGAGAAGGEGEQGSRPVETVQLSAEDLAEAFPGLCAEGEAGLSPQHFAELLLLYMVVVKESAMTDGPGIKGSTTLRRLDLDEIVEVTRGPLREPIAGVLRVRIRALQDDAEGWVTTVGNAGTVFLRECGRRFKVLKEVGLTEALDVDEDPSVEDIQRLQPGEELDVQEWPQKDPASGLVRMGVRVGADGATGWVTLMSNQGTPFLKAL